MKISTENFVILPNGEQTKLFTLTNSKGITVKISNYGGTIISLCTPDRDGNMADVVLGFLNPADWIENSPYFNCIIGRTCNRIGGAKFNLDGIDYNVSANIGQNQLHGGFEGFHKKIWSSSIIENEGSVGILLKYMSKDLEEGFPGNLFVSCIYLLNENNEFSMEFQANSDKATPINLTNHAYFNLKGEGKGHIYDTELIIHADNITTTNEESIPNGEFSNVHNTPYDFSTPHQIGERINQIYKGYDNNYVLQNQNGEHALAATAKDIESGRVLEVYTTEPGVQLYTSNWFDGSLLGKSGKPHVTHSAFCLETQHYPDSMNHETFPSVILRPGQKYKSITTWKFYTE